MKNTLFIFSMIPMLLACEKNEKALKFYPKEKYDFVGILKENNLRVTTKKFKEGVIDKNDKTIIPNSYDEAVILKNNIICIADEKAELFDLKGKKVFKERYDEIFPLDNNRYFVKSGKESKLLDKKEREIAKLKYDEVAPFNESRYLVSKNGKFGLIDHRGHEIVSPKYRYIHKYSSGLALVLNENNKVGFINKNGREIIEPKYDYAEDVKGESTFVYLDSKFGIIGNDGQFIEPLGENLIIPIGQDIYGIKANDRYMIENIKAKTKVKSSYENIGLEKEGLIPVLKDGKYGYVDSLGKVVIPLNYTEIGVFQEGLAIAKDEQGGKFGVLNLKNEFEVKPEYSYIAERQKGYFVVGNDEFQEGVINYYGDVVLPLKYENLDFRSKHLLTGLKNSKLKYIGIDKDKIKEFDFLEENVLEYNDNEIAVKSKRGTEIYKLES